MIALSKKLKPFLFILSVIVLIMFCSCNNTEPEKVNIETSLSVDSSFSGTRTIQCIFPNSIIQKNSLQETNLDKIIQKYCPDSMNYTKNTTTDNIIYSFQLKFNSATDYTEKVTNIIGSQATVSFSNPNTVLTGGWKLEENFESSQLLNWIYTGANTENFSNISFTVEETKTNVSLNKDTQTSSPVISVNNLKGYPIQKIKIETLNKKNSVYDRTVVFQIAQSTFDQLGDTVKNYFADITDTAASSAQWLLENKSYLYTVKFTDVTDKELEGYTNKLLSSIYSDIKYEDKTTGSTPFAEQNIFCETLDFSNYVGNSNSNVPVEYTYSVLGSGELGECMIYENGIWSPATNFLDTNKYGSKVAIKSDSALLNLKVSDGTQYNASAIDIVVTPLENDIISKTITFRYDIALGGNEAANYTEEYFQHINIGVVQSVEGGENTCSITFSGTADEINSKVSDIFGTGNKMFYSQYKSFMSLRTVEQYKDNVNFSTLLVGKNSSIPVNYYIISQNGDIVKNFKSVSNQNKESSENLSTLKPNNKGAVSLILVDSDNTVSFDVSVLDLSMLILTCIIAFILLVLTIVIIIRLKNKKNYVSLPVGEKHKIFENKNTKLAKTEKEDKK